MRLNVNYRKFALESIPFIYKIDWFINYIYALIKPLQTLNNDPTKPITSWSTSNKSLYQYALFVRKFLSYTGQTIYLEKWLNDNYDSTLRRIYIINTASNLITYAFNKGEISNQLYVYNKWKIGNVYAVDERVNFGVSVWKSKQSANTGNQPDASPLWWEFDSSRKYIYNKSEQEAGSLYDLVVYVPNGVLVAPSWDEAAVRAGLNQYIIAGKNYAFVGF